MKKKYLAKKLYKGYTQNKIAKFNNVSTGTVEKYVNKYNLQGLKEKGKSVKLSMSPYFCYFLGLFLTDGYYNPNTKIIEISLKDKDILKLLADKLGLTFKKYKNTYRIYSSKEWSKEFTRLTLIEPGPKTYTAKLPFEVINKLKRLQWYFLIRGMIDGDGTIRKSGQIRFFSCSEDLLSLFITYLDSYNYIYSIIDQNPGKVITILKESELAFCTHIYRLLPELAIKRKRKRVNQIVNDIVRTYEMVNRKKWYN